MSERWRLSLQVSHRNYEAHYRGEDVNLSQLVSKRVTGLIQQMLENCAEYI
jgi:hypothetical protein